jgi:pimeloyl-ACP methyl ester carboxylesterase
METRLGRVTAQCERPEPLKFALPLILIPELFTDPTHLALARGYFASMGWEVFALDLLDAVEHSQQGARVTSTGIRGFAACAAILSEAIIALERDAIVAGHGLGGLLALNAIDNPRVRAAVALAPMLPRFKSRLVVNMVNWPARVLGRPLKPPRGRILSHLLADADPFQREALTRALAPEYSRPALDVVLGRIELQKYPDIPRLIVVGDSDPFAPPDATHAFAESIGARVRVVPGRGHWLVGGRALERTVAEVQRFLVRSFGSDLLLLYSDESGALMVEDDEDG